MKLSPLIQIISALDMTLGNVFGIIDLWNSQIKRKREAAILMLDCFQTVNCGRVCKELPASSGFHGW